MKKNKKTLIVYKLKSTPWILSLLVALYGCAHKQSKPTVSAATAIKVDHSQMDTFQGRGKITFVQNNAQQTVAFQAVGQCWQGLHMQWSVLGVSVAALWLQGQNAYIYIPKEHKVYRLPAQKALLPWTESQWTHKQVMASFCYDLRQVQQWSPNIDLTWMLVPDGSMQVVSQVSWPDKQGIIAYQQFPIGQRYPRRIVWQSADRESVTLTWKNIQKNIPIDPTLWAPSWPEDVVVIDVKEPFSIWTKTR